MSEAIEKFTINIPEAALTDVRERLLRTRWPHEISDNAAWQVGTNLAYGGG